jgi:hypothetical protein
MNALNEKYTLSIIFVRCAVLISQRSVVLNTTPLTFIMNTSTTRLIKLNLDAVESLKLTEKMKGRKRFPFFAGCISSLPYLFLPFVWGGVGVW